MSDPPPPYIVSLDEEIKAVQIMHHAVQVTPHSYSLLHIQCDFLRGKGEAEWALKLANEGVNCAPTEFSTWAKLTECHIETGRWEEVSTATCGVSSMQIRPDTTCLSAGTLHAQLLSNVHVQ